VYARDWPSEKAGISFSTYTSYGMAKADENNNIDLIIAKNTEKDFNEVLENYFMLKPLENFRVKLIDNKTLFSKTTKFYIKAFKMIKKLNQENKIDAIVTRTVNFLPYAYLLKKLYNIKILYEAHTFYLDPELKGEVGKRKKETRFQRWFLPKIDGVICHQSVIKDLYKKYIPEQNYSVITYGFNEFVKQDNLWEKEYIGYIGSLYESKGVKDLFYALKDIEYKDLKLLIVGGRSHRIKEYQDLAKELGIENRVKITGWVDRDKVEKYLKQIKIGLVPLRDDFHTRYLTCPTKIFNYFSHGIPVIGADLPTVKEVVTDKCGLFFEPGNREELVKCINHLNSSPDIFNKYSNNIFNRSKELLLERRGEKIIDFIKSI